MKRIKNGSLTVEAAGLMSVLLMIFLLLMVTQFWFHNRIWYEMAAYEAALDGNARTVGESSQEIASEKAESRIRDQVMPGTEPEYDVETGTYGTKVCFSGQTFPLFKWSFFAYAVEVQVSKVRPVSYMRTLWLAKQLKGETDAD